MSEVTGKLVEIFDTIQVSESFKKREFVVEVVDGQYSEVIKLELIQDNCSILDGLKIGQEITAKFNLKGRKWTNQQGEDKYFNTLQAWRIDLVKGEETPAVEVYNDGAAMPGQATTPPAMPARQDEPEDDMPF